MMFRDFLGTFPLTLSPLIYAFAVHEGGAERADGKHRYSMPRPLVHVAGCQRVCAARVIPDI